MQLPDKIVHFFSRQGFVVVATIDDKGNIHCSAKGLAGVNPNGTLFIMDLYKNVTYTNLQRDSRVSITAVDEHKFIGYTLQGKAKIVPRHEIHDNIISKWEDRLINRITERVTKSVKSNGKSPGHFEATLPEQPEYLIEIDVDNIIDLAPPDK